MSAAQLWPLSNSGLNAVVSAGAQNVVKRMHSDSILREKVLIFGPSWRRDKAPPRDEEPDDEEPFVRRRLAKRNCCGGSDQMVVGRPIAVREAAARWFGRDIMQRSRFTQTLTLIAIAAVQIHCLYLVFILVLEIKRALVGWLLAHRFPPSAAVEKSFTETLSVPQRPSQDSFAPARSSKFAQPLKNRNFPNFCKLP